MKTWDELKADLLGLEDAVADLLRDKVDELGYGFESPEYIALNREIDVICHKMDAMKNK